MVEEMDAHEAAGIFEALCQFVVDGARMRVAARVVVGEGDHRSVVHYRLLDDDSDVNAHLRQTAVAESDGLDEFHVLTHQNHIGLLHEQVLHLGT